jgi:hypothetical protein
MLTLQQKEAYLAMADRHIVEAEERFNEQMDLIDRLAAKGHSTEEAAKVLILLLDALDALEQHRSVVSKAFDKGLK